jgi:hypothetical protein
MTEPIDRAALELLEPLLADLRAGRALVTALSAGDNEGQRITIEWSPRMVEGGAVAPEQTRAPAPADPVMCPACGRPGTEVEGGYVCESCQHDW